MFTGIITHLGTLKKRENSHFVFAVDKSFLNQITEAASVSVNGICLTITSLTETTFTINIIPETAQRTMLGHLKEGDIVNLELPVTANALLSGHIVQGHVDGTGRIAAIKEQGNSWLFKITITDDLARYVVEKGSIAVNGISLTVIEATPTYFTVGITPFTWDHTMLHKATVGDLVNIEVDVFAKYVERIMEFQNSKNEKPKK